MEFERDKTTAFTKKDKIFVDSEMSNPYNDNYDETQTNPHGFFSDTKSAVRNSQPFIYLDCLLCESCIES
jgi:hypothetical protein